MFTWVAAIKADFDIDPPNRCDADGSCLLLVTYDQEINIVPSEWKFNEGSGYRFDYKIEVDQDCTEDECVAIDLKAHDKQSLYIEDGTLKENTDYKLTVKAYNVLHDFIEEVEKELSIKTGNKPEIKTMTISPAEGTMFDTQFEIAMSGYTTTDKMKY